MKIINTGYRYEIYNDSVRTFDKLPAKTYVVRFNKMTGFYMEEYSELEIKENKIYGVHKKKVEKVLRSFAVGNKNLGVILSGDKGIGKSLCAKLLAVEAVASDIPVIIVDTYIPGIASYIDEIRQEVMILFDEFDKTFGGSVNGNTDPQAEMLTLFDGLSQGKKLFVVTCNNIRDLNDYLINRPGRFHYHFRFAYPSQSEIEDYLKDKLDEKYYGEISKVTSFAKRIDLNYDYLRAIAFELNTGEQFENAIEDLNIVNIRAPQYRLVLFYTNGEKLIANSVTIDLFSEGSLETVYMYDEAVNVADITFNVSDCEFDRETGKNFIPGDKIRLDYCLNEKSEKYKHFSALNVSHVELTRVREKSIHYTV